MRQYVEQKKRVGDAILLFRMGDFYETFYEDAVTCANVLGITLTSRSKADNPIPLAGIPYHALDSYLAKLVNAGYRVAISEQMEDPKQAKGVVRRDVVRIVTAGTLTDDSLLSEREDNLLAAVCIRGQHTGLAFIELASGRFEVLDIATESVLDELVRARPAELLIDDERGGQAEQLATRLREICNTAFARRSASDFATFQAEKTLLDHFEVVTLAGFGFDSTTPGLCAAGCVIQYLHETQKSALAHIAAIRRRETANYMQIDQGSWRSLEIDRTLRTGSREGTLLNAIDRTVHAIGSRRLRHWLREPLIDVNAIIERQSAVASFVDDDILRSRLREKLRSMSDIERIAGRIALARATPRDLHGLGRTLTLLPEIAASIREHASTLLSSNADAFDGLADIAQLLQRSIAPEPPVNTREGGFIADGFDAELDRLRLISTDGQRFLLEYQRREIERTGIPNLKVGFNRVFGYYIEISHSSRDRAPVDYVRRQTVKNAERYITEELKTYENEVLTAQERAINLEQQLFERVRGEIAQRLPALLRAADAIGQLDCLSSLAELAVQRRFVRPQITDDGRLEIHDGRHPVLDQTLGDRFVPNDTLMTGPDDRVFVITGPNMAGKSTYIRQVAMLTLMAHIGSFVPARSVTCSVTDRLFARVGSADEIMRGQSTFMVEMTEAANILHHATHRSLVILDELGRGTSTFDGLSLAWAITEHLATQIKCRTLVATHYHEMTELASLLRGVKNYNVAVREYRASDKHDDGIVFLYRILEGGASKSYGIHVAKLAGIPKPIIQRSKEVLDELQRGFAKESRTPQLARRRTREDSQMSLFPEPSNELIESIRTLDPDQTTPLEALQILKEWKERFSS